MMICTFVRRTRDLKRHDAFNRTWWSVLSTDKLVTWQHLSVEITGHHIVLKASSCLRSLISTIRRVPKIVDAQNFIVWGFTKLCRSISNAVTQEFSRGSAYREKQNCWALGLALIVTSSTYCKLESTLSIWNP